MKKGGFTLIEVLIAGGLTAIGLVAIFQLVSTVLLASRRSGQITKAALLSDGMLNQARVEDMRDRPGGIKTVDREQDKMRLHLVRDAAQDATLQTLQATSTWGPKNNHAFQLTTRFADRILKKGTDAKQDQTTVE